MSYDNWRCGGSDPGYNHENDAPEPELFPPGVAIWHRGERLMAVTFGGILSADSAMGEDLESAADYSDFSDLPPALRWSGFRRVWLPAKQCNGYEFGESK